LDVAHNPAAARVLACNLRDLPSAGRTLAVYGILADKDAPGVVAELRDCIDAWWCVCIDGERGRSGASLAQMVRSQVTAPVEVADSTSAGCAAALAQANPTDRIVVFGSFHTVGPALDWLEAHDLLPPATLPEYTAAPRATYV
jgi:dihydrofolate synthase/folylpolyglutamate synthase